MKMKCRQCNKIYTSKEVRESSGRLFYPEPTISNGLMDKWRSCAYPQIIRREPFLNKKISISIFNLELEISIDCNKKYKEKVNNKLDEDNTLIYGYDGCKGWA